MAELTTLRVGGPADELHEATSAEDLVDAVRTADAAGRPVLLVGGGSNLLVADEGVPGLVVTVRTGGVQVARGQGAVSLDVAAGEPWDALVERTVVEGWSGLEAMSGIPGQVGATPVQNVGAYGAEVAQVIDSVQVFDRRSGTVGRLSVADCTFGYRHSALKADPGHWVVLSVRFVLSEDPHSAPIRYPELARALGAAPGARVPAGEVRAAVLALRRGKGMVLDPADHDTWSAGSFFTNPILSAVEAAALPPDAPRFPQPDGRVKTSAAWLISHAGFERGHRVQPEAAASLSTKHVLALTNRGDATAADLLDLARAVRAGVQERFGITLVNEPVLVGCAL